MEIEKRTFHFGSEYWYISVQEYDEQSRSKWRSLLPPEDQRTSITNRQIADLIIAALA